MSDTQRFKIVLPILKTRTEIRKDKNGNEKEVRFVQGVASSTDKDLHGDKMDPAAIKTMADSLKFHDVPLNADHDTTWSAEIGPVTQLDVDENNNLVLEAELSQMSKANDLWYALTEQNKKLGLSIGGYVKEYEMVKEEELDEDGEPTGESNWYRLYKDIDLDHVAVTSSPANPKTWVSAISKSIDPKRDLELIKAAENKHESPTTNTDTEKGRGDKDIRKLARRIARKVQDIEANLLLELTESILLKLDPRQINKVAEYLDTLERNTSMDKTDVSLEAEKAKELADALEKPELEKDENSAALENESSDDTKDEGEEPTPPKPEDKPEESDKDESESDGGEEEPKPVANSADDEASEDEAEDAGSDEPEESPEAEESDEDESKDESDEDEPESDKESEEESTEKSSQGELVEVIKGLTDNLKAVVKSNEELAARVAELEEQPATRKTIEVSKAIGDDDSEEVDASELQKAMDKEIAELREKEAGNPALFSMIQRIRSKYALKAKGLK